MRLGLIFGVLAILATGPAFADDPVWGFDASDPEMNAAIDTARETLPRFYDKFDSAYLSAETMLLKVARPYGNDSHEHIWVEVQARNGDSFDGIFSNDPVYIDFDQYDAVTFSQDQVSDWMYFNADGLMEGAYTIRVMLPRLSEDQADGLRRQLAPLPNP